MRLSHVGAIALGIHSIQAFKDTSPFFLFSTSELLTSSPNLVSASSLQNAVSPQLERCLSDIYIIVSQPGVNAADYHNGKSTPILRNFVQGNDKDIRSSLAVKDVKGVVDVEDFSTLVQTRCGAGHLRVDASTGSFAIADESKPRVINLDFPAPPHGKGREGKLLEHDAFLASVLDVLPSNKYTVIYTTSPTSATPVPQRSESQTYEMDSIFQASLHTELRRDLSQHKRASAGNITLPDGPLFERYQFLSPGLFMSLLAAIILFSILYFALSGVASLQITYAAFDKEMGPSSQKHKAQ